MSIHNAKPFIKWVGGKTQLLSQFKSLLPTELANGKISRYVEPFAGGAALFFELTKLYSFESIILNDINSDLMLTYKVIQSNPLELTTELKALQCKYYEMDIQTKQDMYLEVRSLFNSTQKDVSYTTYNPTWICRASQLIFLNKTCFNGLYRVNKKNEFNVPFGKHIKPTICDKENILETSKLLQNVTILNADFENLTSYIYENTFVYMDPPYRPISKTSSFTDYSSSGFDDAGQIRLSNWFKTLNEKNAKLMLSNCDPKNTNPDDEFFEDLYSNFNLNKVYAKRAINSNGSGRGAVSELVITNY